jgi:hypothetical protein
MRSMELSVAKSDLANALRTLSANRKRRFTGVVPIWLRHDPDKGELTLGEDSNHLSATVLASGKWPAAGVTLNLIMLRRTVQNVAGPDVELHVLEDAIVVPTEHGHVSLKLLPFGPDARRDAPSETTGAFELRLPCQSANRADKTVEERFEWVSLNPKEQCCRAMAGFLPQHILPLCTGFTRETEAYRFIWNSSFHGQAVIHIATVGSKITLCAYRPRLFEASDIPERELTHADWRDVQSAISDLGFWTLPNRPWPGHMGLDGATWKIEGRRGKWYNCVECWSPTDTAFRKIGALFVAFAKLDIELY